MKLTKCSKNHFYDADKSPCCPQCGEYPVAKNKNKAEMPAAVDDAKLVCAACGKDCRPGTKFCVHCGGPVKRASNQKAVPAYEKLVCKTCGKEAKQGMKFCIFCGSSLNTPVEQTAASAEQKMVCAECGQELKPGMRFCIDCGTPVKQAVPQPEPAAAKPVCSGCGKELQPGVKFCIFCGKAVAVSAAKEENAELVFDARFFGEAENEATVSDGVISAAQASVWPEMAEDIPRTVAVPAAAAPAVPVAEASNPVVREEPDNVIPQLVPEVKLEEPAFFRRVPDLSDVACCTSCGLALRPGSVFCNWCGEEVVFEEEEPDSIVPEILDREAPAMDPAPQPEVGTEPEIVEAPATEEEKIVVSAMTAVPQEAPEEILEAEIPEAVEPEFDTYEDEKTVAIYGEDKTEPVVGWLICVKGEYRGQSFELKPRRNSIGRSMKMDVALAKEPSVSRDRHAILTYEPIMRKFYIQCGEGSGLTYVNNEVLMLPREIFDYDVIRLGNCKMILRTLCNDRYTWNDGE